MSIIIVPHRIKKTPRALNKQKNKTNDRVTLVKNRSQSDCNIQDYYRQSQDSLPWGYCQKLKCFTQYVSTICTHRKYTDFWAALTTTCSGVLCSYRLKQHKFLLGMILLLSVGISLKAHTHTPS